MRYKDGCQVNFRLFVPTLSWDEADIQAHTAKSSDIRPGENGSHFEPLINAMKGQIAAMHCRCQLASVATDNQSIDLKQVAL